MKHIIKSIIVLILVFSFSQSNAQTNNIDFTLTSESVNTSGQDLATSSTIRKIGNSLVWVQNRNGFSDTTNFTITGTSGNWNESSSLGELTYGLVTEEYQCELILSGQNNGLSATLIYNLNSIEDVRYVFDVNSISYQ
jgi:hypothetical protein